MEQSRTVQLLPGVRLTVIQTGKFKTGTYSLHLLTPLSRQTAGAYAVLPRVLCRGTRDCPDRQSMSILLEELFGGTVTPSVRRLGGIQAIGFTGEFPDDAYTDGEPIGARAIRLLGSLLLRPNLCRGRLPQGIVEEERARLCRRITSAANDKRSYADEKLISLMYKKEPFGVSPLGDEKSAAKVHYLRLSNLWQALLADSSIELYCCSSLSPVQVERAWLEALTGLPRRPEYEPLPDSPLLPVGKPHRYTEHQPVGQAKLVMGFRTGTALDRKDWPAFTVLNAMFGGSVSSRLFLNVRERLQLCYYAASSLDPFVGLLRVSCGTSPEHLQEAESEILAQLEQLQRGDFTDAELDAARRYAAGALLSDCDDPAALERHCLRHSVAGLNCSPSELALLIGDVTREEVLQAAAQVCPDTVYTLLPEEEEVQP